MTNGYHKAAQAEHQIETPSRRQDATDEKPRTTETHQATQAEHKNDEASSDA